MVTMFVLLTFVSGNLLGAELLSPHEAKYLDVTRKRLPQMFAGKSQSPPPEFGLKIPQTMCLAVNERFF